MIVSLKPASEAAANYADNLCRWNRRSANHYEVWFLTLNQRATRRGFSGYASTWPNGVYSVSRSRTS